MVATVTTMTPPQQPAQRARRPTTLAYCERTVALPRVRRTKPPDISARQAPPPAEQPKATVVTVAADVVAAPVIRRLPPTRVVAPTATPEDSYVEDGSSSFVLESDVLPIDQSGAAETATATTLSAAAAAITAAAQRPHDDVASDDRRTLETSCLDSQSIQEVARLSMTSSTDAATQRAAPQRRAAVRRFHRVIAGARQRLLRQLAHRTVADEKSTATTAFSEDQASSSVTAVEGSMSASASSRSLLAVAGCSSLAAAPVAAVEVDVCSSVGSSTAALSDTETLAADVSLVLGGRRISPGSPSYDEKHSRFSHVGAHALDVFYSPEDDDDDYETSDRSDSGRAATSSSSLWRPLASCSGTFQEQSSASTSLHVPTRSVAFANRVTSGPKLPSVPEALWRPCFADDGSVSVQGPSDGVVKSTSSVLAVLSPTEATSRSSTLERSGTCSTAAGAASVEYSESRLDVSDLRFVVIFASSKQDNYPGKHQQGCTFFIKKVDDLILVVDLNKRFKYTSKSNPPSRKCPKN